MSRNAAKPKKLIRAIAGRAVTTSREASAIYRSASDESIRAEALNVARELAAAGQ